MKFYLLMGIACFVGGFVALNSMPTLGSKVGTALGMWFCGVIFYMMYRGDKKP